MQRKCRKRKSSTPFRDGLDQFHKICPASEFRPWLVSVHLEFKVWKEKKKKKKKKEKKRKKKIPRNKLWTIKILKKLKIKKVYLLNNSFQDISYNSQRILKRWNLLWRLSWCLMTELHKLFFFFFFFFFFFCNLNRQRRVRLTRKPKIPKRNRKKASRISQQKLHYSIWL